MARSRIHRLTVASAAEAEGVMFSHIARGYAVVDRTATTVTLRKPKSFSFSWALIGLLLCVLPLFLYLLIYATRPDYDIVEIVVLNSAVAKDRSATGLAGFPGD